MNKLLLKNNLMVFCGALASLLILFIVHTKYLSHTEYSRPFFIIPICVILVTFYFFIRNRRKYAKKQNLDGDNQE